MLCLTLIIRGVIAVFVKQQKKIKPILLDKDLSKLRESEFLKISEFVSISLLFIF